MIVPTLFLWEQEAAVTTCVLLYLSEEMTDGCYHLGSYGPSFRDSATRSLNNPSQMCGLANLLLVSGKA